MQNFVGFELNLIKLINLLRTMARPAREKTFLTKKAHYKNQFCN